MMRQADMNAATDTTAVVSLLSAVLDRLGRVEGTLDEVQGLLRDQRIEKEWYTTAELAEAMGVKQYTIQERWCNAGRIECEKDGESGKWRIPGREYRRLVAGGPLRPKN